MRVIARKIKSAHIGEILVRLTGKTMTIPREVVTKVIDPVETKEGFKNKILEDLETKNFQRILRLS